MQVCTHTIPNTGSRTTGQLLFSPYFAFRSSPPGISLISSGRAGIESAMRRACAAPCTQCRCDAFQITIARQPITMIDEGLLRDGHATDGLSFLSFLLSEKKALSIKRQISFIYMKIICIFKDYSFNMCNIVQLCAKEHTITTFA